MRRPAVLLAILAGCGSRTGLVTSTPPADASRDVGVGFDVAIDATTVDAVDAIADAAPDVADTADVPQPVDRVLPSDAPITTDAVALAGESCSDPIEISGSGVYDATTIGHGVPLGPLIHLMTDGPETIFHVNVASGLVVLFAGARDDAGFEMARSAVCMPFREDGEEWETVGHSSPPGLLLNLVPAPFNFAVETAVPEDFTLTVETCGTLSGPCCLGSGCVPDTQCISGSCVACGTPGLPCCSGTSCDPDATCIGGMCGTCGAVGQACCTAGACVAAAQCTTGTCTACGAVGEACCGGTACAGPRIQCVGGVCGACGVVGEPCCDGGVCNGISQCLAGTCTPCGARGQACCGGSTCAGRLDCVGTTCS